MSDSFGWWSLVGVVTVVVVVVRVGLGVTIGVGVIALFNNGIVTVYEALLVALSVFVFEILVGDRDGPPGVGLLLTWELLLQLIFKWVFSK